MPNTAETETELNWEALDYVPVYRWYYSGTTRGEKLKKIIGMILNKFESIGFILADKYQKHWRQRKTPWNPAYCRSRYTAPKHCHSRRRKEDAPNFPAEDGTKKTASCMDRQTDWRKLK